MKEHSVHLVYNTNNNQLNCAVY